MDGYLLDTNVLIPLLRPNHKDYETIKRRLVQATTGSPVWVSVAALAELHVGAFLSVGDSDRARREIEETIADHHLWVREITRHTAAMYGDLKARLMLKYNRPTGKGKWPENWPLPDKGVMLGVDEFDLLMVSHALEYGLVLVTNDEMRRIREGLGEVATDLQIEDWTQVPSD